MSPRDIYPPEFFDEQYDAALSMKRGNPVVIQTIRHSGRHKRQILPSGCVLITLNARVLRATGAKRRTARRRKP